MSNGNGNGRTPLGATFPPKNNNGNGGNGRSSTSAESTVKALPRALNLPTFIFFFSQDLTQQWREEFSEEHSNLGQWL